MPEASFTLGSHSTLATQIDGVLGNAPVSANIRRILLRHADQEFTTSEFFQMFHDEVLVPTRLYLSRSSYKALLAELPSLVRAICPKGVANEVIRTIEAIN